MSDYLSLRHLEVRFFMILMRIIYLDDFTMFLYILTILQVLTIHDFVSYLWCIVSNTVIGEYVWTVYI